MKIIETTSDLKKIKPGCVLTIGNFDGVHIGHQVILANAKKNAAKRKAQLIVLTFEPHPVAILHPEKAPAVLTPLKLKTHLLEKSGVDCLVVLKDSAELLNLSPADFVDKFLARRIQPEVVVEGESFNFGSGRSGNVHTLNSLGQEKGFEVHIISTKQVKLSIGQSVKISSTIIRNLLETGKVADAAVALTRPYRLIGKVLPGQGKGKQLGFPTANLAPARQIIPAEGVYAGFVAVGDSEQQICSAEKKIPAAFSIGRSTTYGTENPLAVEAHLLIENVGDLVDKWMAMDFIERIRQQIKFETKSQLSAQIAKDCENVKQLLAKQD
ncbi:MAG: bifunctional riboflavin kinase/FAD synthetase [Planctomycetota bacterium]|nr:MAG: bifunctional riboflavin kinase/FAD synthetase [Planctomycetota bacterium]